MRGQWVVPQPAWPAVALAPVHPPMTSLCSQGSSPNALHLSPPDRLQLWQEAQPEPISVQGLHRHVMHLHSTFLAGLDMAGHPTVNHSTLLPPQVRAEGGGRQRRHSWLDHREHKCTTFSGS